MKQNPALEKAKEEMQDTSATTLLSTGVRGTIVPVGATLIDEITARVKNPPIPMFMNEEKGREEENPNDPAYLIALQEAERERTMAALDAMILFGFELESMPEDDGWLKKLQFMERRGRLDLSEYDLDNELDREFVYKKYVAIGTSDLIEIGKKAGLGAADVEQAAKTFQN